jgi:anti-sigma B factor antagonist
MSLEFTSEVKDNNILIINVEGSILQKLDSEELTEYIEQNIESGNNNVIINLEKLDYMNSTGINDFISYLTKLRNSGGELIITNVSKKVEQLLIITKLHSVFSVEESIEAGLEKLLQTQEN